MISYSAKNLSNAVAAICPDIEARMVGVKPLEERYLWWELSCCILSSQVPYHLATAAADAINVKGFLLDRNKDSNILLNQLTEILTTPLEVEGQSRLYRFPMARARNLTVAHSVIGSTGLSLLGLINSFDNATDVRIWLVKNIPGIGPKQASMFLRNIGMSYDLAILDRHVLNYMSKLGIYSGSNLSIAGLKQYHHYEIALRNHAKKLDCQVGLLDWAIWIVMRVANRDIQELAV